MKRIAPWRSAGLGLSVVLTAVIALAAVTVGPAYADEDLEKYQGDKKNVTVEAAAPAYDEATKQTTFTFTLNTNGENVSHVMLMACPDVNIVSATGPEGAKKESAEPKAESSIKGSPHVGIKFEPGTPGTYTIVFAGNISGAEFVVKDGDGHKHFTAGSDVCKPVTPAGGSQPDQGANQSGQTGGAGSETQVAGENLVNSANPQQNLVDAANPPQQNLVDAANPGGVEVKGEQLTRPEAALARTGTALPMLAPIGALLLALGSLATGIARRRGRA